MVARYLKTNINYKVLNQQRRVFSGGGKDVEADDVFDEDDLILTDEVLLNTRVGRSHFTDFM